MWNGYQHKNTTGPAASQQNGCGYSALTSHLNHYSPNALTLTFKTESLTATVWQGTAQASQAIFTTAQGDAVNGIY